MEVGVWVQNRITGKKSNILHIKGRHAEKTWGAPFRYGFSKYELWAACGSGVKVINHNDDIEELNQFIEDILNS